MDAWGVTDGYWDVAGDWHNTDDEVRRALLDAMGAEGDGPPWVPYWSIRHGEAHHLQSLCEVLLEDGTQLPALAQLPSDLPVGYHQLLPTDGGPATRLVVAPRSCPDPPRVWGWSAQLYALHSDWTWGTGDLGDLKELVRWTGSLGGGAVLVNPLHANLPTLPQQPSPYYPASRRFRNVLYIRLADVPGATLVAEDLAAADARRPGADRRGATRPERGDGPQADPAGADLRRARRRCRRRAVPALARRTGPGARALDALLRSGRGPRSLLVDLALRAEAPRGSRPSPTGRWPSGARTGCASTPGASGWWTSSCAWPRKVRSPSCRIWPSASTAVASTPGTTRTCWP